MASGQGLRIDQKPARISPAASDLFIVEDASGNTWKLRMDQITVAGAGTGDVSSNTVSSVDGEIVLFNGTTGKSVKRGNSLNGILKYTNGVGSPATAHVDFAIDAPQTGTDAANVWTNGVTTFNEGAGLTADRTLSLPATSSYVDGTVIRLNDSKTTGSFSRLILPGGSDTLTANGVTQNSAAWITAGYLRPFIGGGYGGHTRTVFFQKTGSTNWQLIADITSVDHVEDAVNRAQTFGFSASAQTPGVPGNVTAAPGASVTMNPFDPTPGIFLNGVGPAGELYLSPIYTKDVLSNQDDITTITGNAHAVPDTGLIDNVRLSATLAAPLTLTLPSVSNYRNGQYFFFYDASGSVNATNYITLVGKGGDTVNQAASVILSRDHDSRRIVANPSTGDWAVETYGGSSGAVGDYIPLTDAATINVACDQTITEQHWSLTGTTGIGSTRTIAIGNARRGERFRLHYTHNSAGSDTVAFQSAAAPANGLGLLTLSTAANALDVISGSVRSDGKILLDTPSLNLTFAAPATYNTTADSGPSNSGANNASIGSSTGTKYVAFQFLAGSSYTCGRVDVNLKTVGTPANLTGNIVADIAADDVRSIDSGAIITSGSSTVTNATTIVSSDVGQRVTSTTAGVIPNPTYIGAVDTVNHTFTLVTTKGGSTAQGISSSGTGVNIYGKPAATSLATSNPVAVGSVPSAYSTTYTSFIGFATSIASGTTYWVVLHADAPLNNAVDYIQIRMAGSNTGYISRTGTAYPPGVIGLSGSKANFTTYKP